LDVPQLGRAAGTFAELDGDDLTRTGADLLRAVSHHKRSLQEVGVRVEIGPGRVDGALQPVFGWLEVVRRASDRLDRHLDGRIAAIADADLGDILIERALRATCGRFGNVVGAGDRGHGPPAAVLPGGGFGWIGDVVVGQAAGDRIGHAVDVGDEPAGALALTGIGSTDLGIFGILEWSTLRPFWADLARLSGDADIAPFETGSVVSARRGETDDDDSGKRVRYLDGHVLANVQQACQPRDGNGSGASHHQRMRDRRTPAASYLCRLQRCD